MADRDRWPRKQLEGDLPCVRVAVHPTLDPPTTTACTLVTLTSAPVPVFKPNVRALLDAVGHTVSFLGPETLAAFKPHSAQHRSSKACWNSHAAGCAALLPLDIAAELWRQGCRASACQQYLVYTAGTLRRHK